MSDLQAVVFLAGGVAIVIGVWGLWPFMSELWRSMFPRMTCPYCGRQIKR